DEVPGLLGRYRDPWFGEADVCASGDGVRFASARSPRLSGPVLRAGDRLPVDFDTLGPDADAWLDPAPSGEATPARLAMAKVDPEADFSYDYEDLSFTRIDDCPSRFGSRARAGCDRPHGRARACPLPCRRAALR